MYLKRNDFNHSSFAVYVEAVNQTYDEFERDEDSYTWICPNCGAENSSEDSICYLCENDDDD